MFLPSGEEITLSDMKLCECHGEPMLLRKAYDGRPSGVFWRCAIKTRANDRTERQKENRRKRQTTDAYREKRKSREVRYNQASYLRKRLWKLAQEKKQLTQELDQLRKDNPWLTS